MADLQAIRDNCRTEITHVILLSDVEPWPFVLSAIEEAADAAMASDSEHATKERIAALLGILDAINALTQLGEVAA